jgi:hypothetical protein
MDSDSDLDSDLDLDSKTHSPYRMTYIAGQGTQSAVGMKPIDLASNFVHRTWSRYKNIQLPFKKKGLSVYELF